MTKFPDHVVFFHTYGITRGPFQFVDTTRDRVLSAARLKAQHSISYADAFAVALAQELDATVVTGDAKFRRIATLIPIDWVKAL